MIGRHHFGFKHLNVVGFSYFCQLAEQDCAQSSSLIIIRDGKGNLGAMFVEGGIKGVTRRIAAVAIAIAAVIVGNFMIVPDRNPGRRLGRRPSSGRRSATKATRPKGK